MINSITNYLKEKIDPDWSPQNHIFADFFRVLGKTIQNRAADASWSLITALYPSRWSRRLVESLNNSTTGILNREGTDLFRIFWEKGDHRSKSCLPWEWFPSWTFISHFSRSWIFISRPSLQRNFLLSGIDSLSKDWSIWAGWWSRWGSWWIGWWLYWNKTSWGITSHCYSVVHWSCCTTAVRTCTCWTS